MSVASLRPGEAQHTLNVDAAIDSLLRCAIGDRGLPSQGEQMIRDAARAHIDQVILLADYATTARIELEAIEGRMDRHVGAGGHEGCTVELPCLAFRVLQIRREKCWRAWAVAYRALLEGKRR